MNKNTHPKNIALIMDGNRRWAMRNGLSSLSGHKYGAKTLNKIVKKCLQLNIDSLTVFAFSTENWKRPPNEVNGLFKLMEFFIKSETADLNASNIVLKLIGDISQFSPKLKKVLETAEDITKNNSGLKFNVALNYGGKQDILNSIKKIISSYNFNKFDLNDINEELVRSNLNSSSILDFDLLIRTGGEKRLSNFMLWQLTYSELFFTETLWPDFSEKELEKIIEDFHCRDRRFGKLMSKRLV